MSLKTNPQTFDVYTLGPPHLGFGLRLNGFTPATAVHPNTSTSINPSFSKWVFGKGSHGDDYGGNDSKCNTCHGNLDMKPSKFSDITVNNGFCFRYHYGKSGTDKGFIDPAATPKASGFEALSVILALIVVFLIKRK